MKSRTSFFNKTVFFKNVTRFAPAWGLYTLCLMMGMLLMADSGTKYWFLSDMAQCIQFMVVVNLLYAPLVAMLLFGDLYNSRMCNALHAMPLRRESWFLTNVVSGVLFSLVPTVIMTIPSILLSLNSDIINGWQIPLYWLLGTNLSYLFFFGLAVLCVFLVGNRFAMAVCYGIFNAAAVLAFALVDTLYTPLLYGVHTWEAPFEWLTPVVMMTETTYITCLRFNLNTPAYYATFTVGDWRYLAGCAVIGVALMLLALQLYRKRKLECAGDFMAVKALEPVFLVAFTLAAGVVCFCAVTLFIGTETVTALVFLVLGILVGFFGGRMLLMRTVRVFRWKALGGCAAIIAAIGVTMGITWLDPLGISGWMPEPEEVETVVVNFGHYNYRNLTENSWGGEVVVAEEDEEIQGILRLHELSMDEEARGPLATWEENYYYGTSYTITYYLTDGSTVSRYYDCFVVSEVGGVLREYFSSVESILGVPEEELSQLAVLVDDVYLCGEELDMTNAQVYELLEAIAADCRTGNMAQRYGFHEGEEDCECIAVLTFGMRNTAKNSTAVTTYQDPIAEEHTEYVTTSQSLDLFCCCEHTLQWIQTNFPDQYEYVMESGFIIR